MASPNSIPSFDVTLTDSGLAPLRRDRIRTLQVNVGLRCNQACHHCHVGAGPLRRESMSRRTAQRVLELLAANPAVKVLDLTGGAPELNPSFRDLVRGARRLGRRVIDRCNLTVLLEPGQEDTADFLAAHRVEIVASLPCYQRENVERQRGKGVWDKSVAALERLNRLGYGSELPLDLVYNPGGPTLPPAQPALEEAYRRELRSRFGIEFHRLLTLTNMPLRRFGRQLREADREEAYLSLLVNHFNPATVPELMCTSLLSVGYDGRVWDCDFNQMLELEPPWGRTVWELGDLGELEGEPIATAEHCFGCTAGSGSSCGGALV